MAEDWETICLAFSTSAIHLFQHVHSNLSALVTNWYVLVSWKKLQYLKETQMGSDQEK